MLTVQNSAQHSKFSINYIQIYDILVNILDDLVWIRERETRRCLISAKQECDQKGGTLALKNQNESRTRCLQRTLQSLTYPGLGRGGRTKMTQYNRKIISSQLIIPTWVYNMDSVYKKKRYWRRVLNTANTSYNPI